MRETQARAFGRRADAFSMLEIVLAVVILAIALLPILGTMVDTGREAGFTEAHLLATARAQALLDSVEVTGFVTMPRGVTLASIAIPASVGDPPAVLVGGVPESYKESLQAERLEPDLVMIRAKVLWTPAATARGRHSSSVGSIRLLRRADGSWTQSLSLGLAQSDQAD